MKELNKISDYDPDHLPAEIEIIELFKRQFPSLLEVACFNTSFHTTLPRVAKILPNLKKINGIEKANGRIILAHSGSGASLASVKSGESMNTTMGFTPAGRVGNGYKTGS